MVSLLRLVLPDDLGFGWHVLLAVGCGAVIGLVVGAALRARRRSG